MAKTNPFDDVLSELAKKAQEETDSVMRNSVRLVLPAYFEARGWESAKKLAHREALDLAIAVYEAMLKSARELNNQAPPAQND